jgi:predicted esterase
MHTTMSLLPRTSRRASCLFLAVLCLCCSACRQRQPAGTPDSPDATDLDSATPASKPTPPLSLPQPPSPTAVFQGQDLSQLDAHTLLRRARQLGNAGNEQAATAYQFWAVTKTGVEQYDLACYLARLGQADAAFYWLQVAGVEDGVWAEWSDQDPDLELLRRDSRWPAVRRYLARCKAYWAAHGKPVSVLVLPKGYDGKTPLPALVWLHGTNTSPDFRDHAGSAPLEAAAERLHVAVLGVSGSIPLGKAKFNWSENPERDYKRVQDALEEVGPRVRIQPEQVILFGFSQGGQVGLEIAARHPETIAGAIAVAPGAIRGSRLQSATRSALLKMRGFVIGEGELDSAARDGTVSGDAEWLREAGAKLKRETYAAVRHALPRDLGKRLPDWVRFIREARERRS